MASLPALLRGAGLALAIGACDKAESAGKPGGAQGGGGPPAMPVEVVVARTDTVVDAILATGQIEAMQSIELSPDVEGRIAEILVREGAFVTQGTPLFKVDDAELKAQVARAEADRDLARQSLTRTKDLLAQQASFSPSSSGRRPWRGGGGAARSAQGPARPDRGSGAVRGRRGPAIREPRRLCEDRHPPAVAPDRVAAAGLVQVPERYADQLKVGQQVTFRVAALRDKEFVGRVDFVDPVVQLPGRTITVKAVVPNPRRELQSGMFIEARLATAVRPSAVVVPEDAIVALQGSTFVWVVDHGKATRRQVDLGVRTPGFVEARSGVEASEQVVVGGQERLGEGAPVTPKVVDRSRPRVGADSAASAGTA